MSSNRLDETPTSGLLLIDKPADFSSHDIIAIVRRVLKTKKIGHSGTLDPMATGLLILLVGREATKRQDQFLKLDKTYSGTLKLGQETASWDAYSETVREQKIPPLTQQQVEAAARQLTGLVRQPIPFYSAKRIKGEHMYELARKGCELERKFSEVTVSWPQVRLTAPDEIEFTVNGSCGTYVRSLGFLLAQALGTVGHLTQLRRERIGNFVVTNAFDGNLLKNCPTEKLYTWVQSL